MSKYNLLRRLEEGGVYPIGELPMVPRCINHVYYAIREFGVDILFLRIDPKEGLFKFVGFGIPEKYEGATHDKIPSESAATQTDLEKILKGETDGKTLSYA